MAHKSILYILYWLLVGSLSILAVILYFYSSTAFFYTSMLMIALIILRTYNEALTDKPHLNDIDKDNKESDDK